MNAELLKDCVLLLQTAFPKIEKDFLKEWSGYTLRITQGHRPPEVQYKLYQKGRKPTLDGKWIIVDKAAIVTNKDGFRFRSKHNLYPSKAIDVAILDKGHDILWPNNRECEIAKPFLTLFSVSAKYGVETGYWWNEPFDPGHLQV